MPIDEERWFLASFDITTENALGYREPVSVDSGYILTRATSSVATIVELSKCSFARRQQI